MKTQYKLAGLMMAVGILLATPLLTYHYLGTKKTLIHLEQKNINDILDG